MSGFVLEFEDSEQCVLHSFYDDHQRDSYFRARDTHSMLINDKAAKLLITKDEGLRVVLHV